MTASGRLIVLSGPSGSGKSTVVDRLLAISKRPLKLSVSATTRAPRPGEMHGRDYFFMQADEFERARLAGDFLESAQFVGNWYGTPARWVREQLAGGGSVLLEIEVQGSMQIRAAHPDSVLIFLKTASLDEYARRLRQRGTNSVEDIRRRLERAERELQMAEHYDFVVVNDDVERAVREIESILDRIGGTN